jgi:hypothetical protein
LVLNWVDKKVERTVDWKALSLVDHWVDKKVEKLDYHLVDKRVD